MQEYGFSPELPKKTLIDHLALPADLQKRKEELLIHAHLGDKLAIRTAFQKNIRLGDGMKNDLVSKEDRGAGGDRFKKPTKPPAPAPELTIVFDGHFRDLYRT